MDDLVTGNTDPLATDGELMALMGMDSQSEDAEPVSAAEGNQTESLEGDEPSSAPASEAVQAVRNEQARISAIQRACASFPALADKAIASGWTAEQAELAMYRAEALKKKHNAAIGNPPINVGKNLKAEGIKAALSLNIGQVKESAVKEEFGPEAVSAAKKELRTFSKFSHFAMAACDIDGVDFPRYGADAETIANAAFSSTTFTEMLSGASHLVMMNAYNDVPGLAKMLFASLTASDFHEHKGVRLTGDLNFLPITDGGEIKHGNLGEGTFRYSLGSHGRMLGITREDIISDNLGAFLQIPRLFGRGAALTIEAAAWKLVLDNAVSDDGSRFFSSNHDNLATGAGSALSIDALALVEQLLDDQVGLDGNPILVNAKWLVVPSALYAYAQQIFKSANRGPGTGDVVENYGEANIYAGAYEPVKVRHLKSEPDAWYLWGDPNDIPAFGIAWLNGVQMPTIEEVQPRGDYLGRMWRGYLDFGVCQIDPRGAVKATGK